MVNGSIISENKFTCEKSLLDEENSSNIPKKVFEKFSPKIEVLSHDGSCTFGMEFSRKSNSFNAERKLQF